mgnify:CR=1 FL=1
MMLHSTFLQADELEWGAPGADERVRRLAALKPDLVLAADCCYIDQDGESPSTPHFIQACKGGHLCCTLQHSSLAGQIKLACSIHAASGKACWQSELVMALKMVMSCRTQQLPSCLSNASERVPEAPC